MRIGLFKKNLLHLLCLKNKTDNKSVNKKFTFIENIFMSSIYWAKYALYTLSHLISIIILKESTIYSLYTNEKTRAQTGKLTFPRSHN